MPKRLNKPTVLIVDDVPDNIEILNQILSDEYRILFATSGALALSITQEQRPDVILLDISMPDMDGYQVCRELKDDPNTRDIPIIFVTAMDRDEDQDLGFRIGGADYLTKPVRPAIVRTRIKNQLQLSRSEELILRQALYDGLTNLPNRSLTMDRLKYSIAQGRRNRSMTALLFIDLDNFKDINDTQGHDAGDQLLVEAATRLRGCIRDGDTVGRLGGDEFLVILPDLSHTEDARFVAESILRNFSTTFHISGIECHITVSIGIAISPDDGSDPKLLLGHADTAMYQSKHSGKNAYHLFNQEMNRGIHQRMQMDRYLHYALEKSELVPHFQPVIDTASGRVHGVEALLRWNSKELGSIPPDQFIGLAEQNGLIEQIGMFVLRQSCLLIKDLVNVEGESLSLAVNVSPQQFRRSNLPKMVMQVLEETGIAPERLELEVTEGLLLHNRESIKKDLITLRALGVKLSMDDFGTGYSSLSYLRSFPFDIIKIDRMFITDLVQNPEDEALVTAAVAMAHGLGLKVVAEGVENREQLALLTKKECDLIQGYFFSPPMPVEQLKPWLDTHA